MFKQTDSITVISYELSQEQDILLSEVSFFCISISSFLSCESWKSVSYRVEGGRGLIFSLFHLFYKVFARMFPCTIYLYGDWNIRMEYFQDNKGSKSIQVFYNMVQKVKFKCVPGIVGFYVESLNHGRIKTDSVFLDLQKIFFNTPFTFRSFGEIIWYVIIYRMNGSHWITYPKPSTTVDEAIRKLETHIKKTSGIRWWHYVINTSLIWKYVSFLEKYICSTGKVKRRSISIKGEYYETK